MDYSLYFNIIYSVAYYVGALLATFNGFEVLADLISRLLESY